jgi:glucose/arabinose dehydrogenase/mono/diheme cytochrome c family protein
MSSSFRRIALLSLAFSAWGLGWPGPARAGGLTQRVANTTLRMPSSLPPLTTNSYVTTNMFPGLSLSFPLALATPPGETNRLFIVEQAGRIVVITNLASPTRTVFMDIASRCLIGGSGEGGLLGLAFHPQYASNRSFFVFYTATGTGFSNRISRFTTQALNPNAADTNSEVILIGQFDEASNHNAGSLHFGPDGYLYASLGDEGDGNDTRNNSQTITGDFFAGIIRIDVDKKPGSLPPNHHPAIVAPTNYAIPPDNPYIGVTNFNGTNISPASVRTEFHAIGLRNPFRMSFDPLTGDLYAGDVGQAAREEVDLIRKGGNYGWAYREGKIAGPKGTSNSPTNYVEPLLDYLRGSATNQGNVVTGGAVYRGNRFPELVGRYVFSDYGSGHIWSMSHDGTAATSFNWLTTDNNISSFGYDPRDGELLMTDLTAGQVKRLAYAAAATNALPQDLADTGVFSDLQSLTPNPGILPYDLNVPFWSDGALKSRWFSVPATNLTIAFDPMGPWIAPTSTVWVKHFDLPLTSGVPASARRIETRVLVKNSSPSGGYGVTYRWGSSLTNAVIAPAAGLDELFLVNDGGTVRTQVWHYPSRTECMQCHNSSAGLALGFSAPQLNRDRLYDGVASNQIAALSGVGYFDTNVTGIRLLRKLAEPTNTSFSVEYRARSYLQANCAQCHFPGGPTPAGWDARALTPLSAANIVNGEPANTLGDTNNRVARPGSPTNSMLHTRIATRGPLQMPPVGSTVVDTQGVALVAAWISTELTNFQYFADWQVAHFGSSTNADAAGDADPDGDGDPNDLEFLTGTNPTNILAPDAWTPDATSTGGLFGVAFERIANRGFDVQASTNLVDGAWQSLDVPENSPFFGASTEPAVVPDPASGNLAERYYRVRVYEP